MTKNATIRLSTQTHTFLKESFQGIQSGVSLLVEPFDKLMKINRYELKGYFTKEELTALIDSQNGVLLTPDFIYNSTFLIAELEDFEQLENGISRHNADAPDLLDKIKKLSSVQVYYLLLDIHILWQTGENVSDYLDKLA